MPDNLRQLGDTNLVTSLRDNLVLNVGLLVYGDRFY